jgi:hypothetical protein
MDGNGMHRAPVAECRADSGSFCGGAVEGTLGVDRLSRDVIRLAPSGTTARRSHRREQSVPAPVTT